MSEARTRSIRSDTRGEILFVRDAVAAGIGIGIIPIFLRHARLVRVLPG